jgi:hypothetical protein
VKERKKRMSITLTPLNGTDPFGLLVSLGTLGALERADPGRPTLSWNAAAVPRPTLYGYDDADEVVRILEADRISWQTSTVIFGGPGGVTPSDLKMQPPDLASWFGTIFDEASPSHRQDTELLAGLLAQGAVAGNGDAKPTHLDFTAGQQRFLVMVRRLATEVGVADLDEAIRGPWRYESDLPVLRWEAGGERIFALRGTNPSKEKQRGVPGADWLAFLGLSFLPVVTSNKVLLTTGCERNWKNSAFTWPLWTVPLSVPVVRSLLGFAGLRDETSQQRRARGIDRLLRAPIHRTDQGGYGSFGAAADVPLPGDANQRRGSRRADGSRDLLVS